MGFETALYRVWREYFDSVIVFFVFPKLGFETYWTMVSAAEAFAVITEAIYLSRLGFSAQ